MNAERVAAWAGSLVLLAAVGFADGVKMSRPNVKNTDSRHMNFLAGIGS